MCCDNCPAAWHVECIPSGKQRTAAQLPVQQLVVPRLRHRGGDAGHLKFGSPTMFFRRSHGRSNIFLGVVKNIIKPSTRTSKGHTCPMALSQGPRTSHHVTNAAWCLAFYRRVGMPYARLPSTATHHSGCDSSAGVNDAHAIVCSFSRAPRPYWRHNRVRDG